MSNENSKPGKIYAALNAIMTEVEAVPKGQKNAQQGYSYRGVDDFYAALHGLLSKHKVFVTKRVLAHNREERETRKTYGGEEKVTVLMFSIMEVEFTYHAEDGSFVTDMTVGEAMDSGDKASNKAMSSAFKYSLMQIFAIPTKEDKDTEKESHEVAPRSEPEKPKVWKATPKMHEVLLSVMSSHVFSEDEKAIMVIKEKINSDTLTNVQYEKYLKQLNEEAAKRKQLEKEAEEFAGKESAS